MGLMFYPNCVNFGLRCEVNWLMRLRLVELQAEDKDIRIEEGGLKEG